MGLSETILQIRQFYSKADPDDQASRTRRSEAKRPVWLKETYQRIWSTLRVSPGWATCCRNHWGFAEPLTLFIPSSALRTPKSWPASPRRSHAVHQCSPWFTPEEITSPPRRLLCFWLTPAWNTITAKPIRKIRSRESAVMQNSYRSQFMTYNRTFWQKYQNRLKKKKWNQHCNMSSLLSSIQATLNICFSEKQGQKCCLRFHLLIFALVFLSGVWEQMTNNTEGSTCRSLKVRERYDLSLWLTCAISLHTYSNSWLNPSFSHFSHHSAFAFSLFWSILQDKDLLFIRRSHLDPGRVATGRIWISYDDAFHEVTVNIMSKKHRKISNKYI